MGKKMNEENAFELVQEYMLGWKQNSIDVIKSCLTEDCVVIESHGPIYHGIGDIEKWFKLWIEAKSKVLKWEIITFSFCVKEEIAFCEWDFSCVSNDSKYDLTGISVVKFSDDKISFIHEYRMIHPANKWDGDKLKSN
jgi:ketosteroid isomerase-like protein